VSNLAENWARLERGLGAIERRVLLGVAKAHVVGQPLWLARPITPSDYDAALAPVDVAELKGVFIDYRAAARRALLPPPEWLIVFFHLAAQPPGVRSIRAEARGRGRIGADEHAIFAVTFGERAD
jgi:hypothetical protein